MSFNEYLKNNGWVETQPYKYVKKNWMVVFDTSKWIEVGTNKTPRIFDVPVPNENQNQWTLNLIEHLCKTDDELNN